VSEILKGVNRRIDEHLGITDLGKRPAYAHKSSWKRVADAPVDWSWLVAIVARRIESNWDHRRAAGKRLNWRNSERDDASPASRGEKELEQRIATTCGATWTHRVPTCSGVNTDGGKKRSVDLAHFDGRRLELIELELGAHHVLHAAIEVLICGALYWFSRTYREPLGYAEATNPFVFAPSKVSLKVLAPTRYYEGSSIVSLKAMEDGLCKGLRHLPTSRYEIDFSFEKLPSDLSFDDTPADELCRRAIAGRTRVVG